MTSVVGVLWQNVSNFKQVVTAKIDHLTNKYWNKC